MMQSAAAIMQMISPSMVMSSMLSYVSGGFFFLGCSGFAVRSVLSLGGGKGCFNISTQVQRVFNIYVEVKRSVLLFCFSN